MRLRLASLFRRTPQIPARRAFEGAAYNRLTAGWMAASASLDQDLRAGLDTLRARSREMCQNNEYAVRFLGMVRANVVGPKGIRLMAKVRDPSGASDAQSSAAIESAWEDWGRYGRCEISQRHSLVSAMHAACNSLAQDGEILLRLVVGPDAANAHNFAFQLLDPSRLDTGKNRAAAAGSRAIIMGVEVDDFHRPTHYHFRDGSRLPADQILHRFLPMFPEQTRGIPWMHAAIRRMHDLGGYREAAIIAARVGASKMGFFAPGLDADPDKIADGYQSNGIPYASAEPGEFGVLPQGVEFTPFNPDYPHDQFDAFIKAALRGIAAGLGVSYHGLANDLTDVSYSSIRSGSLEERDQWRVIQSWFASAVAEELFSRWLPIALLSGAIKTENGTVIPAAKLEKLRPHDWQPRTWEWVDPESDMNAVTAKINANLSTITDEAAKLGADIEDILATRQRERQLFSKYGESAPL